MLLPKYKNFKQERQLGEYTIYLPDPPDLKKVANYKLAPEKQKFHITKLPRDFEIWPKEDRLKFIKAEWQKRNEGYFFFNKGNLEYITGTNYLYINWWPTDTKTGRMQFVDSDRDFFYVWKHTEDSPKSCGLVYISYRREGKTFKASCILYDAVSKTPDSQGGIQSKNDTDAGKVFRKLVTSWQKLPFFFKPVDVGMSRPVKMLEFFEPSKRDTKTQKREYREVLNSYIDFEHAREEAYDGLKQLRNFQDEIGKTVNANVSDRIKIVRECVMDGTTVIGKIIATTTVEEMEKKGGKHCEKVWEDSDPNERDENGFTKSGLDRYFNPADYGLRGNDNDGTPFIDEYGYSDRVRMRAFIERRRANLSGDDLASEKRKYPLEVQDCFITANKNSHYDIIKIEEQLRYNKDVIDVYTLLQPGNFIWKDGQRDTEVMWQHDPNGRWLVSWLQQPKLRNNFKMTFGQRTPANTDSGCFGLDPYDNKLVSGNKKSNAASYGFRPLDPLNPVETNIFISEYVNRPPTPEMMWEDMIMQCVFYGWEILVESNKIGTINYFRQRGYYNYLMERTEETHTEYSRKTQKEKGIPLTSDDARLSLIRVTQSYIYNNVGMIQDPGREPRMGKCYFNRLLSSWKDFDFENKWTEFDEMVGAGLALLGARKQLVKTLPPVDINLFPQYKIVKNISQKIR